MVGEEALRTVYATWNLLRQRTAFHGMLKAGIDVEPVKIYEVMMPNPLALRKAVRSGDASESSPLDARRKSP